MTNTKRVGANTNDEMFMGRCIELAAQARSAGETPVGAMLVCDGIVVAEAIESTRALHDPGAHAEALAVRAACQKRQSTDLSNCTLYTTVEPCVLCSYVIRKTGVGRVVYGVPAAQSGGATSRYAILTDASLSGWPAPPEITSGILAEACRSALQQ